MYFYDDETKLVNSFKEISPETVELVKRLLSKGFTAGMYKV